LPLLLICVDTDSWLPPNQVFPYYAHSGLCASQYNSYLIYTQSIESANESQEKSYFNAIIFNPFRLLYHVQGFHLFHARVFISPLHSEEVRKTGRDVS